MMLKKINEITIVGPGLIGGSLGLAIKNVYQKIGIDKSKSNLNDALKMSIDEQRTQFDSRIGKSQIILCTPVSQIDPLVKIYLLSLIKKQ